MKISARNAFSGKITALQEGAVNAEVEITTAGGDRITAMVTEKSLKSLGLAVGKDAVALFKAPLVTLLADSSGYIFTARNHLAGTVSKVVKGSVNTLVTLTLPSGAEVDAVITNEATDELGLAPGSKATALVKAGQVLLGVKG